MNFELQPEVIFVYFSELPFFFIACKIIIIIISLELLLLPDKSRTAASSDLADCGGLLSTANCAQDKFSTYISCSKQPRE
jgi:hypothetical protein